MFRITAIGAGAVDYLLHGCDDPGHDALEVADRADSAELGADQYFARAIAAGEPAGVWLGKGWEALEVDVDVEVGRQAAEDDVRAIFGQLRRPESTERDPEYIGSRPRTFVGYDERLAKLQASEPDAAPERLREMERQAAAGGQRAVAYYDWTFSPPKSVSVLYAAYLAAGLPEQAELVRAAHDEAVKVALGYAEERVAYTRFGRTEQGRVYAQAEGLAAVLFNHHTSRAGEPQLHAHLGVLNRVGAGDGRIGALDGKAARPFKEAIGAAYDRAVEQGMTEKLGVRFETRPDGLAREVAGMDPELLAEASTRRGQVTARVQELLERYRERHGREPGAAALKAMAQEATLSTRVAKAGLAGPAAVAAWADGHRDRLAAAIDDVELTAMAMATATPVMATDPERLRAALTAGLADVQLKYATWQLGNLVDAIDRHLGDADALGVPASQRPAALEALAHAVVDPASGYGVVQLTGHEPVEVPAALLRSDGRPVFRPHEERRFATAAHLDTEAGVAAFAATGGAQRLAREVTAEVASRAGLSADQAEAVLGIVDSGRRVDVLVGPAGTGKSRTVGALAQAWGEGVGGTVYGVATSQIATSNLAGDGLTALNTRRFLDAVTPDPITGQARRPLTALDLVVVDEASMAATPDLAAVTTAAARAGAKVLFVGDPDQLDAVAAGGLFAHLADTLPAEQVHALDQPHRFTHEWEAKASLQLRAGDPAAVETYTDHRRLRTGTVEEMAAAARRGWLADRFAGRDAALIVGSNATAADMSRDLRAELVELGIVDRDTLAELGDRTSDGQHNRAGVGDVVEARRNAWDLRVDPSPEGVAEPVMNRGRYTIVGRGDDGTLLGRDRHGGIAHLPEAYLRDHAALGYAITEYGAQGVTVDAGHQLVDRDATREAVYVGASRGREHNYLYLVTEHEPDAHEPQRIAEVAAERLTDILGNSRTQRAATAVQADAELEEKSAPALLSRLHHALTADARDRHLEQLRAELGDRGDGLDPSDRATERLLAALQAVQLDGHDPEQLIARAAAARGFDDVDSVADVMRHRIRGAALAEPPGRDVDAADWTTRIAARDGDELTDYALEVAERLNDRQRELGDRAAAELPPWAAASIGERPDPDADPVAALAWRDRAGAAALYREYAGIGPDQPSLGEPPTREQPLERALYDAALSGTVDSGVAEQGRDWRAAADAELYAARERWARESEQAPPWVADELADASRAGRQWFEDAVLDRARLEQMEPDDPGRAELAEAADRHARWAERDRERVAGLEVAHERRTSWWERTAPDRVADRAAADELERRGLPETRVPEPEPAPEPDVDDPEPEREPVVEDAVADVKAGPDLDAGRDELEASRQRLRDAAEASRVAQRDAELARAEREAREAAEQAKTKRVDPFERGPYTSLDPWLELDREQERARLDLGLQRGDTGPEPAVDDGLELGDDDW